MSRLFLSLSLGLGLGLLPSAPPLRLRLRLRLRRRLRLLGLVIGCCCGGLSLLIGLGSCMGGVSGVGGVGLLHGCSQELRLSLLQQQLLLRRQQSCQLTREKGRKDRRGEEGRRQQTERDKGRERERKHETKELQAEGKPSQTARLLHPAGGWLTPASWEPVSMSWVCCRAVCEGLGP